MRVTLRLFASARDSFGFDQRQIELERGSLEDVRSYLSALAPSSAPLLKTCRFAVNREYAGTTTVLKEGDEVAVIPPVSGG